MNEENQAIHVVEAWLSRHHHPCASFQDPMEGLRESERRLREIIDALPVAIYTTDAEGRLTHFNPAAVEFSGRVPELGSDHWCVSWKLYRPDGTPLPHDECPMAIALKEGRSVRGEEAVAERPDGKRIWFMPYPTPLRDAEGQIIGGVNMLVDITERRRAEEASALLAAIVQSSNDAMISKDLNGIITSWNGGAERLFGYTAVEAIGRSVTMLIPPDRQHEEPAILERLRRGERVDQFETVRQRKDGTLLDISLTISPVKDASGRIIGASKVARDITDRRRADAALRQSEEALREADRRKDEFLAVLAHELRNPLGPILNAVKLMQQLGSSEPRQARAREIIERQVQHQARLLEDLLDVSRITRGKIRLRPERLDLVRLVRDAAEDCRGVLEAAGLALSLELPEVALWVKGDPTRLSQVVTNLLQNAAKFTDRGGQVMVRLAGDSESQHALLTIRDTGIGIEPEMLPHIFETFAQADHGIDRSRGGLGLGLALVKGLVELHHGDVWARSDGIGCGSEFTIQLPTVRPAAEAEAGRMSTVTPTGPIRVLIVEDNRDAAESLRDLLELSGCTVAVALSGLEALEVGSQFRPEVVLCDLGLPGLNGYQVAAELRRNPVTARARLIAVSGYGQDDDVRRSREAGFDLHLTKPVDFEELLRFLEVSPGQGWEQRKG